ncbi:FUSC family protein [Streptomyces sp. NBC_00102]|uniref:FUSC family protein n=1 Tax=Streptomyces sp. NBC_00102 TaxID=2975652 RepID=UPI00224F31C2|nr:FUSC family protein [Streptomyces sp. NBC_00102]MCX5395538.1 FUSC family protein [Streptomyces sp. NBC_00102]
MSSATTWRRAAAATWGFFAPRYTPGSIAPNVLSAAISSVTVLTACLAFGPKLGMISLMGAMTPFWETGRPLWARVRNSLLVAAALTGAMSAGVLIAPYSWAVVPASVVIIVTVTVLYYAFMLTRGPSPVMMFYAAILGTYFGADPTVGWQMVGVTAFAALLASVLLMVPLVFAPRAPEERAVAAARRAVADYRLTEADGQAARLARNAAYQAVNVARLTLHSAWPATRGRHHQALASDLLDTNRALAETVLDRLGSDAPAASDPGVGAPPGRPGWRYLLGHALRGDSVEWFTAWRIGVAAGVAGLVSLAVGIGHPYWAILTATIVINQWMDRVAATRRAAHRTVGTLLGVGVVWGVFSLHPGPWWTVAAVVVCMIGQYLLFPLNYALALIAITPMALLAVGTGGGSAAAITADRFTDTFIGAATAVAVTWATSWAFPRRLVRSQSARAATAIAAVRRTTADGASFAPEGRRARVELQYELIHHLSVLDRAVADDPRLADLAPAEHRLADEGYAVLGQAWQSGPARQAA